MIDELADGYTQLLSKQTMVSMQKVLIGGGGIDGLVAAVALRQKNKDLDVEIVEAHPQWMGTA